MATVKALPPPVEDVPSVEKLIDDVERALALGTLITTAICQSDDMCLPVDLKSMAFLELSSRLEQGWDALCELKAALPDAVLIAAARGVR